MQHFEALCQTVRALRHPQTGCPWDLAQTHQSLQPHMLEEAYEAVEAMALENPVALKEELGDVLLQVLLHAQLATEAGTFTLEEIAQTLNEKLIRRHPHVFGDNQAQLDSPEAVSAQWQDIKRQEKAEKPVTASILDTIQKGQPALTQAYETSKKAVKVGFDWPTLDDLKACVESEWHELWQAETPDQFAEEWGDLLFALVNVARHHQVHPEVAMAAAVQKFTRRFQHMEAAVEANNQPLTALSFAQWDALWNAAKAERG